MSAIDSRQLAIERCVPASAMSAEFAQPHGRGINLLAQHA
jgi:hypothetical protein